MSELWSEVEKDELRNAQNEFIKICFNLYDKLFQNFKSKFRLNSLAKRAREILCGPHSRVWLSQTPSLLFFIIFSVEHAKWQQGFEIKFLNITNVLYLKIIKFIQCLKLSLKNYFYFHVPLFYSG